MVYLGYHSSVVSLLFVDGLVHTLLVTTCSLYGLLGVFITLFVTTFCMFRVEFILC
jgi:F0F1-type ATP synthase membrane subunit c/vacuolar-type H+-ATPase subunit K